MKKILIVGAGGQIGSELTSHLRKIYGANNVVASDVRDSLNFAIDGPYEKLDVLDATALSFIVHKYNIDSIYNLVALLSATGEANPMLAWKINMGALINCLEVAKNFGCSVFTPSSIGAFGNTAPKDNTPQDTVMQPNTIYGVCKVSGEMLGNYYFERFGVDARSVRFPGLISNVALPGGGTTDYAVEIFYSAVRDGKFTCNIPEENFMDMMYMPDALDACVNLMEADSSRLIHRNSFNIASLSFNPPAIFEAIKKRIPSFEMDYNIDSVKSAISASWPNKLDDTCARQEWDWAPKWDMDAMVDDMLMAIRKKLGR